MRATKVLCSCLAIGAVLPASATAGQIVYQRAAGQGGTQLWVMNDDGSGQRAWLDPFADVPASGTTRFVKAFAPEISVDGRRVVFTTQTSQNAQPGSAAVGYWAQGVNVWEAGAVRRLTPPPAPGDGISTFDTDGSPATDGRIFYVESAGTYSGYTLTGSSGRLRIFGADGSDGGGFGEPCDDVGLSGPAPSPADPGLVAYSGCDEAGIETVRVAHAGRVGERIARSAPPSAGQYASSIGEPSWRPDGARIVSVESDGTTSSLVSYAPDGTGPQTVLSTPGTLSAPHYVGNDRVAFAATPAPGSDAFDIYVVSADCAACALGSAQRLTTDGGSRAPSWSAAGLVLPASPAPAPAPPAPGPPTVPIVKDKALVGKVKGSYKRGRRSVVVTLSRAAGAKAGTTYRVELRKGRATVATGTLRARTLKLIVRNAARKHHKARYPRLAGAYTLRSPDRYHGRRLRTAQRIRATSLTIG